MTGLLVVGPLSLNPKSINKQTMKGLFNARWLVAMMIMMVVCFVAQAQKTTRFAADPTRGNNTGSALNYKIVQPTQVAGIDTTVLRPNAFRTLVVPVNPLNDSLCLNIKDTTQCRLGDELEVLVFATAATRKLKFTGAWIGTSSFSCLAGKRVTVTGRYHRGNFVQTAYYTQP